MKELIVKHSFDLQSNMSDVRESIAKEISKHDVIIEEDKLPEAKHLMALFNKDKKIFTDECKKFLNVIEEPIKEFKKSQKEIEALYDDGRERIKSQVEKFEATKLLEIEEYILNYLHIECSLKNINPDSVSTKDLVMISAVTGGTSLTKKTKDAITSRIQLVENEMLKARIESEEKAKRDREIAEAARIETEQRMKQREIDQALEFERQKQAALQRAEQEKADAIEKAKQREIEFEAEKEKAIQEALHPKVEESKVSETGQKIFVLNARFEVPAPWNSDPKRLEKMLSDKLSDFKSLISVSCSN